MPPPTDFENLVAGLETDGPEAVRSKLSQHAYGIPTDTGSWRVTAVTGWLAEKDRAATALTEAARSAREEEALSVARNSALSARDSADSARASAELARSQFRWAKWSAIIAVVAALIAAQDQLRTLSLAIFG